MKHLSIAHRILDYLEDTDYEICVNRPGEAWIDRPGVEGMLRIEAPDLTEGYLKGFATTVAGQYSLTLTKEQPIFEGSLLTGERLHIVQPPACIPSQFIVAIRKPPQKAFDWNEKFKQTDYFNKVLVLNNAMRKSHVTSDNTAMIKLAESGEIARCIELAIESHKSILVCGEMSSGKTSLSTSMLSLIPSHERIGVIEDAQELVFTKQNNIVRLIANQRSQTYNGGKLVESCMRLNLQRVIVGELRNSLIVQFIKLLMVAVRGGISTLHADNHTNAINLLVDLYREASPNTPSSYVTSLIRQSIDVMLFIRNDNDYRRAIGIYFPSQDASL